MHWLRENMETLRKILAFHITFSTCIYKMYAISLEVKKKKKTLDPKGMLILSTEKISC